MELVHKASGDDLITLKALMTTSREQSSRAAKGLCENGLIGALSRGSAILPNPTQ
jgi:hypothetical protein